MVHPNVCPVKLIDKYMDVGGLTVVAGCTKSVDSKNRCDACGRLFRATDYGWRLRSTGAANHGMTKTSVATAVSDALARVGVDPQSITCKSMRQGGLSTAAAANVEEGIRVLQSGHKSTSNRAYEVHVVRRYEFSRAFGM